ncbi:MAG TPA: hypothetical protein VGK73_21380 [Polyangiaceae bacterium]
MASPAPREPASLDPLAASTRVVESAVELARAELRLALTRTGVLAARAFGVLVVVAIAMPFVQVTLALLALAPLIGALKSPFYAVLAVAIPLLISGLSAVFLVRAVRALKRDWKALARGE